MRLAKGGIRLHRAWVQMPLAGAEGRKAHLPDLEVRLVSNAKRRSEGWSEIQKKKKEEEAIAMNNLSLSLTPQWILEEGEKARERESFSIWPAAARTGKRSSKGARQVTKKERLTLEGGFNYRSHPSFAYGIRGL